MEFDCPVQVHADRSVTIAQEIYAPEIYVDCDSDGQISNEHESTMVEYVRSQGWELMTGYTGQYSYSGPVMHSSEYIGGRIAEAILSEPGIYVSLAVEILDDSEEPAGWVVAKKI